MDLQQKTMMLFMALAIVMTACPSASGVPVEVRAGCCPTFWTAFGQHCYRFFGYRKTWYEAENFCQTYAVLTVGDDGLFRDSLGHLASIHSETEQNFLARLFQSSRKQESGLLSMWLGMHDTLTEGHFEWSDGTPFTYTKWSSRQPDNWRSGEDCGEMRNDFGHKWNDRPCSDTRNYFVCMLPAQ